MNGCTFIEKTKASEISMEQDGPYLFYINDKLSILRGKAKNAEIKSIKKECSIKEGQSTKHKVSIPQLDVEFSFNVLKEHVIPEYRYNESEKVFVTSDIEGDFDFFQKILISQNVMDSEFNWTYDDGHLVVIGDIFDRGKHVTEVLWLMYKLDQEATKAGGHVHIILGNHELMALTGDHRYIHPKYENFTKNLGIEYKDLYAKNTVLGQWLRSKNSIEIIGNNLFVHGGISPILSASGLEIDSINNLVRTACNKTKMQEYVGLERLIMGPDGPLWYRELIGEKANAEGVKISLKRFGVEHMIVGHTVVKEITSFYDNAVYAIDVHRKKDHAYEALLIEKNKFYKVTTQENKTPI